MLLREGNFVARMVGDWALESRRSECEHTKAKGKLHGLRKEDMERKPSAGVTYNTK
jgi:hypothetical protein